VAIEATEDRYPAEVEATAYFVVAEGLTNIARYAEASTARVVVRTEGERLVVRVTDDGRGGADPGAGSGLRGLADRLAAIGGELAVTSEPGSGTTLQATLPVGS
jgi:signal transduction histidine kinase